MGMKGVTKLSRKIFRNICKRDRDLWRSYEDACQNDNDFLTELGKFLESYEKCLIHIKDEGTDDGFMRILEKMKNINGASGRDQMLLEKVKCLMTQRDDLHKELIHQKDKPRNKYACAWRRCLKLVTHIVFIGAAAAEFACTIVAAVMAAPLVALAIAAAIIPTLAGQHWTLSWVKNYEVPFKYPDNVIRLMQFGTMLSIKELGEIQTYLCGVVKDIESLVSHLNSVTEGDVNLNMKSIECLLKNIDELMERARNCKSLILDARDEVSTSIKVTKDRYIKEYKTLGEDKDGNLLTKVVKITKQEKTTRKFIIDNDIQRDTYVFEEDYSCPQQNVGSSDCGPYMLDFIEAFMLGSEPTKEGA